MKSISQLIIASILSVSALAGNVIAGTSTSDHPVPTPNLLTDCQYIISFHSKPSNLITAYESRFSSLNIQIKEEFDIIPAIVVTMPCENEAKIMEWPELYKDEIKYVEKDSIVTIQPIPNIDFEGVQDEPAVEGNGKGK